MLSKFAKYLTLPEIISHIMQNIIHSTFAAVQKTEKTLTQTQLFGFVRSREAWLRTEFSVRSHEARLQTDFFFWLQTVFSCS